ncbi:hypothetical protein SISNIDRAFT_471675 [Sistotremastrum niveocremeum HHB9708]|uniref:Uncharacterized protein n=1 Tax=Sistotremastrum niveocremeum HHB9708 TaxID=1314777 RepID=A0A164MCQ9_9AGAM|nr:hypothetical protein SISNIDRAFT_471680 [Sistotremastrum niveocremeum HHB9708]KZS86586.1 hypothetical protein SISNIDRAFT_471675 [Sistotremastrum niveocremeum HHB9708]
MSYEIFSAQNGKGEGRSRVFAPTNSVTPTRESTPLEASSETNTRLPMRQRGGRIPNSPRVAPESSQVSPASPSASSVDHLAVMRQILRIREEPLAIPPEVLKEVKVSHMAPTTPSEPVAPNLPMVQNCPVQRTPQKIKSSQIQSCVNLKKVIRGSSIRRTGDHATLYLTYVGGQSILNRLQAIFPRLVPKKDSVQTATADQDSGPSSTIDVPVSYGAQNESRQPVRTLPTKILRTIRNGVPYTLWREPGTPAMVSDHDSETTLEPLVRPENASIGDIYEIQQIGAQPVLWVMSPDPSSPSKKGIWLKATMGAAYPADHQYCLNMRVDGTGPSWVKRATVRKYEKSRSEPI